MKHSKLEDCCLTIEQTKELQALGIDFSHALMYYAAYNNNMKLWERDMELYESDVEPIREVKDGIFIPTFTNTEMLEMLPKEIDNCQLKIVPFNEGYCVEYELYMEHSVYVTKDGNTLDFCFPILKDALFEMIKCLKTNKLM